MSPYSRFACPACQVVIRSPKLIPAGTNVKCPQCSHGFAVPANAARGVAAAPAAERVTASPTEPAPPKPDEDDDLVPASAFDVLVDAICPSCKFKGSVPDKFVGKSIKCRKCAKVFRVAGTGAAPATDDVEEVTDDVIVDVEVVEEPPARKKPRLENEDVEEVDESPAVKKKPRARQRNGAAAEPARKQQLGLILAGAGGGALLVIALLAAIFWGTGTFDTGSPKGPPIARNPSPNPMMTPPIKTKEPARLPTRPDQPAPKLQPSFEGWLQDFEQAKAQAARENKDIFLLFDGSDWCGWSIRLAFEVLFQAEFRKQAEKKFVLVLLDFPQKQPAISKVQSPAQNQRLSGQFGVRGYPTAVLTDAQGRPYAQEGYVEGGTARYLARLDELQQVRIRRDQLLAAIDQAGDGLGKLRAAQAALDFLDKANLEGFYEPLLESWNDLARQHDPKNEHSLAEVFFQYTWLLGLDRIDRANLPALVKWVARLDECRKVYRFRNGDRAAQICLVAASIMAKAGKEAEAARHLKEGVAYQPTDPKLRQILEQGPAALGQLGQESGTGFVIAPGGYILTNAHVVANGKLTVRLPGLKEPAPLELIAKDDEQDIALVRCPAPEAAKLRPLVLNAGRVASRGEKIAALGYPLGDSLGIEPTLSAGIISRIPERASGQMLVLDAKVNPGNSGGPLCDTAGNVVGMVTAKSGSGGGIESYGMAIPAPELDGFLKKHLKTYKPALPGRRVMEWEVIDKQVSPSVLMIISSR